MAKMFHFLLGQITCVVTIQDELKEASTTSLKSPCFTTGIRVLYYYREQP